MDAVSTPKLENFTRYLTEKGIKIRILQHPDPRTPEVQLLSNGHYHVIITSAGGSRNYWNDLSITRWRGGSTRDNTVATVQAMRMPVPLAGSAGSVLDPIVAIRYQITLEPEQTATTDIVTGIDDSREICLSLLYKYPAQNLADRVVELSWPHSQVVLHQLNPSAADDQLYGRLASSVLYVNSLLRADASVLIRNHRRQSGLFGYAISGDLPIVLALLKSQKNIELVRQLVQAHAY